MLIRMDFNVSNAEYEIEITGVKVVSVVDKSPLLSAATNDARFVEWDFADTPENIKPDEFAAPFTPRHLILCNLVDEVKGLTGGTLFENLTPIMMMGKFNDPSSFLRLYLRPTV